MKAKQLRAALWEALIARAESFHDAAVLSQAQPTPKAAAQLARLAADLVALARVAQLAGRAP